MTSARVLGPLLPQAFAVFVLWRMCCFCLSSDSTGLQFEVPGVEVPGVEVPGPDRGSERQSLSQGFSFSRKPTAGPISTCWTSVWWAHGDAGDTQRRTNFLAAVDENLQHLASDTGSALLVLDCTGHQCSQS